MRGIFVHDDVIWDSGGDYEVRSAVPSGAVDASETLKLFGHLVPFYAICNKRTGHVEAIAPILPDAVNIAATLRDAMAEVPSPPPMLGAELVN